MLPDARRPNAAGLAYYDRLIDRLRAEGIQPMVTMYHYDLPARLHAIGGWTNAEIRKHFQVYARLLFRRFGASVRWWMTVNEPFDFCVNGYGSTEAGAPMVRGGVLGAEYLCVDNVLKAHAQIYRLYRRHFWERQRGKIGISLSSKYFYDADLNAADSSGEMAPGGEQGWMAGNSTGLLVDDPTAPAVDRAMQFELGWLAHPLFSAAGGYPATVAEAVAARSVQQRLAWSRLPQWTPEWRRLVRGSADFLGLNHYTSRLVRLADADGGAGAGQDGGAGEGDEEPTMSGDRAVELSVREEWRRGASQWQYAVPQGLGDILRWVEQHKISYVIPNFVR